MNLALDFNLRAPEAFLSEDAHITLQKTTPSHAPSILFEFHLSALMIRHDHPNARRSHQQMGDRCCIVIHDKLILQSFESGIQFFVWTRRATELVAHVHAHLGQRETKQKSDQGIHKQFLSRKRKVHTTPQDNQRRETGPTSNLGITFDEFFVFDDFHEDLIYTPASSPAQWSVESAAGDGGKSGNYFFKLSSIADFMASSTLASAAAFATRTALFIASASERP